MSRACCFVSCVAAAGYLFRPPNATKATSRQDSRRDSCATRIATALRAKGGGGGGSRLCDDDDDDSLDSCAEMSNSLGSCARARLPAKY